MESKKFLTQMIVHDEYQKDKLKESIRNMKVKTLLETIIVIWAITMISN